MKIQLEVNNASIAYGDKEVVNRVSFTLQEGDIGSLLGPSGCGKTSLLRSIAGFEPLSKGEINLQGCCVAKPGYMVAPEKRRVGMVFQDFALYPHLTVADNVIFGLRGETKKQRSERLNELLQLVDLQHVAHHYPHQLSGGQQQRVALVRAMAPRPDILLLDEPFSGLDVELREQLAREVRDILKRDNITAVLVTHDQLEAFAMADFIGVLGEGRLRQWATGYDLYHKPADPFVADFIGQGVMLAGTVTGANRVDTALGMVEGSLSANVADGDRIKLLLRPDDLLHDDDSPLQLEVVDKAFRGAEYLYTLKLSDGSHVMCLVQSHHDHAIGRSIGVRVHADHLVTFPAD
ncbi:MAG: ABC transporter ATP-binding protein [Candidatus Polarisedimenticolaceae bacterium]|nr:ABC transporter ATP-binding protein [Candidatus Polarisedimenticolaceae bacterium]